MNHEHLRTLMAIVDEGSFEGAAEALGITPSAVSQRVKALETDVGRVVVERVTPPRPTVAGETLLRLARHQQVLLAEARAELDESPGRLALGVAVNADSLATWFGEVLTEIAAWDDVVLRLGVDDQAHTRALLRGGDVLAGVTDQAQPVAGCRTVPLGEMVYRPVCSRALAERHRDGRGVQWATLPVVRFNVKDDLQAAHLAARGASAEVVHEVPASEAFAQAVLAGLGWGMLPEQQATPADLARHDLVVLPGRPVRVALQWQVWHLGSPRLERLTETVVEVARRRLAQAAG